MKKTTRILAVVLALILSFSFAACSSSAKETVYQAATASMWGIEVDVAEVYEGGFSITLVDNGKCTLVVDGKKASGKWSQSGSDVHIEAGGVTLDGVLSGDTITVDDVMDTGLTMVFLREGATMSTTAAAPAVTEATTAPVETQAPVVSAPAEGAVNAATMAYWNRDWYGWWIMGDCTGGYEGMDDYWWDACAWIQVDESGDVVIIFYDEDSAEDSYAAKAYGHIEYEDGEIGYIYVDSGDMYQVDLASGEWIIYPEDASFEGYEGDVVNTIEIDGIYVDGEDGYSYNIYLRPWGQLWDDFEDWMLPRYYEDWYLPLIESGVESAPPTIG